MKKVGIVMPAINLWKKYSAPAIESVQVSMTKAREKDIECRLLFLDNNSDDCTKEEASKINFTDFEYKRNEEMWGFQQSVNFGVKFFLEKDFDYVLVLNNDIVLHQDAVTRLVERFEKGGVGMVTCMDVRGECDGDPKKMLDMDSASKESVQEAEAPNFSAFTVSKECWETVGEFDELFHPAYYEDNDYHYRMRLLNVKAIVYPPALFYHWGSRTQNEAIGRPLTDSGVQGRRYIEKWGGYPGNERFKRPFNDSKKDIKNVKQQAK